MHVCEGQSNPGAIAGLAADLQRSAATTAAGLFVRAAHAACSWPIPSAATALISKGVMSLNSDKPESKRKINREMVKGRKHEKQN
jgi:hypothetical protein